MTLKGVLFSQLGQTFTIRFHAGCRQALKCLCIHTVFMSILNLKGNG